MYHLNILVARTTHSNSLSFFLQFFHILLFLHSHFGTLYEYKYYNLLVHNRNIGTRNPLLDVIQNNRFLYIHFYYPHDQLYTIKQYNSKVKVFAFLLGLHIRL